MKQSFPFKSSLMLAASELCVRGLGVWYATKLLPIFGAQTVVNFRSLLPILTVGLAFGTIGIPNALTRILSVARKKSDDYMPKGLFAISAFQVATALYLFLMCMFLLQKYHILNQWLPLNRSTVFLISGLGLILSLNGPMRGVLFGLGDTVAVALAPLLDIGLRLVLITVAPVVVLEQRFWIRGLDTLLLMTLCGELSVFVIYCATVTRVLLRNARNDDTAHKDKGLSRTVLRIAMGTSIQSTIAGLGYALEIPLAVHLLSHTQQDAIATTYVAEYAAVCLPILCAPMVLTDGLALALLPAVSGQRVHSDKTGAYFTEVIRLVSLVALPYMAVLWSIGTYITQWFGLLHPSVMLAWLTIAILPLYLQAPLAAMILAIGKTRHLIVAGLTADAVKIVTLWVTVQELDLSFHGLILAFILSTFTYTVLLFSPFLSSARSAIAWKSLFSATQVSMIAAGVLTAGLHVKGNYSFTSRPLLWILIALGSTLASYGFAGELSGVNPELSQVSALVRDTQRSSENAV